MGYLSPPPAPAPVVVYKDVGGFVSDYEAQTEVYRRENREVRLHECRSACTMALSLPNVCVYPDAQVKFHQAYNANTRQTDYSVSTRLFGYYPEAVQDRLGHLTREYHVLSGLELIALGVRNCNGPDRVLVASKKPSKAPNAASDALGEIARSVRTAVAGAFEGSKETPSAPIRVAVADRNPVPPIITPITGDTTRLATASVVPTPRDSFTYAAPPIGQIDPENLPTPPRRPPSSAFDTQDAQPKSAFLHLIPGSQPIVENTQFSISRIASR